MKTFVWQRMGRFVVLTVVSAALLVSPGVWAHQEESMDSHHTEKEASSGSMPMMKMMKKHNQALNRLDEKLSNMKQARGEQRIDAMSEVIEELVAQRRSQMKMRMGMMNMCMGMMKGKMMGGDNSMMDRGMMNHGSEGDG